MTAQATVTAAAMALLGNAAADVPDRWTHAPDEDRLGRIYYYERTNSDGSMDERITVFRRSDTRIEVYKENGLCSNAALVTADLDLETLSAPNITGGRLQPNAEHVEFAYLRTDEASGNVDLLVQLPDVEIRDEAEIPMRHWVLFDLDLASLTVATPHIDNRQSGFGFGLALLWPDPNAADPFVWLGEVDARFESQEEHLGVATERYQLTGSAFHTGMAVGREGRLWLDANEGHIVDAVLPVPNHPGYKDFRLRLIKVSDGGATEWRELLTAHFANCDST